MTADDRYLSDTTDLLERTPRVLHDLLDDLPDSWLGAADQPDDGWAPRDVVGHLISAELDDWIPRIELIVTHGTQRPFEPFDRFAHVDRDEGVALARLLDRFGQLRATNLVRLSELVTPDDLDRLGRHPSLGDVSLRQLLATWAVHDLDHLAQLFAALSGSRDTAVGPWKAYLGILLRRDDPAAVPA